MIFINKIVLFFFVESGIIILIKICLLWINCYLRGGKEDLEVRG